MGRKKKRTALNLDDLIEQLMRIRDASPVGGETIPYIRIPGYPYQEINEVILSDTVSGGPGDRFGVVLILSNSLSKIIEDYTVGETPDPPD